MRTLSFFYLCIVLVTASFFSSTSSAHSNEINQATLSLENAESFQLVVEVDFIHLLKKHLAVTNSDNQVIELINQLSFFEQKKLLENVKTILSDQTSIQFEFLANNVASTADYTDNTDNTADNTADNNVQIDIETEENYQHTTTSATTQQQSVSFSGLTLQQLKQLLAQQVNLTSDKAKLFANGNIPSSSNSIAVRFSPLFGDIVLKVVRPQQEMITATTLSQRYLVNDNITGLAENSIIMPEKVSNALDYVYQGFVHIIPRGLDHILFVLALLLFAKSRAVLLWQVSAFTLAHTITLALGIYGIVEVSSAIVEPLIALSIVYVALENIHRAKSNTLSHTRMPVIFAFGLLHGLGFASVLADVGLPQSQYALSLISFNIGVELGQLTVIALAFICLLPFRNKNWYQTRLVKNLNGAIAIMATYWLFERLLG
ncbi:HupE/UreJ family protein [Colwellia polaris]|jgi:hydrogenase/urease accessory protein HupE|uniref:HupE/UreJ family protein n=1 Tax=Colwellia polaris TaxID=326537 RepID=UPI0018E983E2|nr:HupE/UreJ family protein [Colwellia polaris]|tara:strand:+ start:15245 stop:16537 length:1293 start_codon:yes stop_codon:yes gene_type:complete